jgi:(p)ppGpp synthase/HD superfamily hydrolase
MDDQDRAGRFREPRFSAAVATRKWALPRHTAEYFLKRTDPMTAPRPLTPEFEDALVYAARLHANQARKASDIPYVWHLLSVCALVLEFGGSSDQAIAALLHDAIEDQAHGNPNRLRAQIRRSFGDEVLRIVEACTDTDQEPKPDWKTRKKLYIERLRNEDTAVALVAMADKLHNARTMLADYRKLGDDLWDRFNAPRKKQLWYLESVADVVDGRVPQAMVTELKEIVEALRSSSSGAA